MRRRDLAGIISRTRRLGAAGALVALTLGLATALSAPAGAVGRIDRPGVYALGVSGQYGLVEGDSRYGLDFDRGPGYSVHFHYNTGRKTALAVYFDNQTWDAKTDSLVNARITAVHAGIRFFSIPNGDVLRYFELTAGFYRPEIRYPKTFVTSSGDDVAFPGEGLMGHLGAGLQIFFTQSWALDVSGHGYLLKGRGLAPTEVYNGEGDWTVSGQIAAGLTYYLLR